MNLNPKTKNENFDLNNVCVIFYKHQLKIKTFHFQTKFYGSHKASDSYLTKFEKKFDRFMECAQGISDYGRITLTHIDISCETLTDDNIRDDLTYLVNKIRTDIYPQIQFQTDLTNILDDMIGDIHNFIYLLSFK